MKNARTYQTRLIRGAMLVAMLEFFPKPTLRATVWHVVQDLGLNETEFDQELAYLKIRGWITVRETKLLGRAESILQLTANGVDTARGIDPQEPLLVES